MVTKTLPFYSENWLALDTKHKKKAENESISLDLMRKPQNDNELLTMARHEKASSFTFYDSDSRAQNMREWTEKIETK